MSELKSGMVRSIDDLGRVVIPKEIRKTAGISYGDDVEICCDGDTIYIRKYYGQEPYIHHLKHIMASVASNEQFNDSTKSGLLDVLQRTLDVFEESKMEMEEGTE